MSRGKTLTGSQRSYIIAHLNERPRAEVARKAGVSVSAVYRLVRENGGELRRDRARRNPEWVAIVRKHYPTMAGHEIERRFGIPPNRANKIAHDLGIRHTPETEARILSEARTRLRANLGRVDQRKKAARWKRRRLLDQWRVWEGKAQNTGFRFATMTRRAYKAKYHLIRKYGYIAIEDEPYTLLYDSETRRRPHDGRKNGTERYYTEKHHLQFKPEEP